MKKRKRKLTEEERQAAVRRVLTRSAKDVLYMWKILPNRDNPRYVAKYLAQEILDFPPDGARKLRSFIEWRWSLCGHTLPENDRRFLGQILIALGEYLLKGRPMFDDVDIDAANIKRLQPHITNSEIVSKLKKLHPNFTKDALEKRVGRGLLKNIPKEYLEPPAL